MLLYNQCPQDCRLARDIPKEKHPKKEKERGKWGRSDTKLTCCVANMRGKIY